MTSIGWIYIMSLISYYYLYYFQKYSLLYTSFCIHLCVGGSLSCNSRKDIAKICYFLSTLQNIIFFTSNLQFKSPVVFTNLIKGTWLLFWLDFNGYYIILIDLIMHYIYLFSYWDIYPFNWFVRKFSIKVVTCLDNTILLFILNL